MQLHIANLDFEQLSSNKELSIWGEIYIDVDGCCFPDNQWYDAVSSLLDMWLDTLVDFVRSGYANYILYFMDGPYKLHLSKESNGQAKLSCIYEDEELICTAIDMDDLIGAILSGVDTFLTSCSKTAPCFFDSKTGKRLLNSYKKLKAG